MTKIKLIVAVSENGVIGNNNKIPWHLPEELQYFKRVTMGHPIIMGKNTFLSLKKPLPGRQNIILSRTEQFSGNNVSCFKEISHALDFAKKQDDKAIFIIGGAAIYDATLALVDEIYYSVVKQQVAGDTYFPSIDWNCWVEQSSHDHSSFIAKHFVRAA